MFLPDIVLNTRVGINIYLQLEQTEDIFRT